MGKGLTEEQKQEQEPLNYLIYLKNPRDRQDKELVDEGGSAQGALKARNAKRNEDNII